MTITSGLSGPKLRGFIERAEKVTEEKAALTADAKVIFAEAKAAGFDPKTIRKVIKLRAAAAADLEAEQSLLDTYLVALGMAEDTPLFRYVGLLSVDLAAREQVVAAFKALVPETGEVIIKMGGPPLRLFRDSEGAARVEEYVEAPLPEAEPDPMSVPAEPPPGGRAARRTKKPKGEAVTPLAARVAGREAAEAGKPATDNPFKKRDERHGPWAEGWANIRGDGAGPPRGDVPVPEGGATVAAEASEAAAP